MPFEQVVFMASMLVENEYKRERQLMRATALQVWLNGGGPKKTYPDFIQSLGLAEYDDKSNFDKQEAVKKSHEVINIIDKFRGKKTNERIV